MVFIARQEHEALKIQFPLCFISKGKGSANLLQNEQLKFSEQSPCGLSLPVHRVHMLEGL